MVANFLKSSEYLPSVPLSSLEFLCFSHHPVPPRILLTRFLLGVGVLCAPLWGLSVAFCLCTALLILSAQPDPAEIFVLVAQIICSGPGLCAEQIHWSFSWTCPFTALVHLVQLWFILIKKITFFFLQKSWPSMVEGFVLFSPVWSANILGFVSHWSLHLTDSVFMTFLQESFLFKVLPWMCRNLFLSGHDKSSSGNVSSAKEPCREHFWNHLWVVVSFLWWNPTTCSLWHLLVELLTQTSL